MHLARAHIYWPGIDAIILNYIKHCPICTRHKASQTVQPMLPRDIPDRSWQQLAPDYFTHYSKGYLLIVNPFSKYLFIFKIHSKTSHSLIKQLQDLFFHNMECPNDFSLIMDPLFIWTFFQILSTWGIDHLTSSPLYPESNGFIEPQIKTIKTFLITAKASGISIDYLLQNPYI